MARRGSIEPGIELEARQRRARIPDARAARRGGVAQNAQELGARRTVGNTPSGKTEQNVLQMIAEHVQRIENRSVLPQRAPGIGVSEITHLEVEMGPGCVSALSHGSERLTGGDAIAGFDENAAGLQ